MTTNNFAINFFAWRSQKKQQQKMQLKELGFKRIKFIHNGYGAGLWNFDNEFARTVVIFDANNISSRRSENWSGTKN